MLHKVIKRTVWTMMVALMAAPVATAGNKLPLNDSEKEWLESVSYIITHQEQKAFRKKMKTHAEREAYIEYFWARRDTNPATEVNEFKEAYLERLKNADKYLTYRNSRWNYLSMKELYMLLGKPDRRQLGTDFTIMGTNRIPLRYSLAPPEVWEYRDVGYGFRKNTLKVQFLATSSFGDYIAITDPITERFLESLKAKLIVNPDPEVSPRPAPQT
ncbi:MAG: GWxTD domain-containing protein [Acidobacteriota bacterium]|nr:GWxTD domain-containing protein [Acidobacteriota bacterium]